MSNQSRVILITLLLVFAFGAWFLPSQAQRSSQRSAPSGKATPPKSSAAKPTTGLSRASQSKSVDAVEFHAVGFAESPPARDLPAAGNINPGAPDKVVVKTLSIEPMHGVSIARRIEQVSAAGFSVDYRAARVN